MNDLILRLVSKYCDVKTLATIEKCSKCFQDDEIWKDYAYHSYGNDFWNKALKRNDKYSRPCTLWKDEIKRMYIFEKYCDNLSLKQRNQMYYEHWSMFDAKWQKRGQSGQQIVVGR